ncbi:MAG: prepilin-type N-terminal cleavage/methylation domain-containing protein [Planctomycetales bacterium]|nr:prepilin-type N-terminal cleavage/methylation domain-containing protein [Planctomycetales bacterium]
MTSKASASPRGFTLLEMILVLALLVAVAAMVIPSLRGPVETARLRSSAESIREEFAAARVAAMKSGRIQMFRCRRASGDYQVVAWEMDTLGETGNSSRSLANSETAAGDPESDLFTAAMQQLPDEIEFLALAVEQDLRSSSLLGEMDGEDGVYLQPILFYADGTTSTAELVLKNNANRIVRVSLRGLTGTVKVSDVSTIVEAFP